MKKKIYKWLSDFTKYEPLTKELAVENTLYLLRRDFSIEEQNEVIVELINRLDKMREKDLEELQQKLESTKQGRETLKVKLA